MFTRGFAYEPGHKYDTGLLFGKRATVSVTTGTSEDTYAPDGIDGALLDALWPVHNGLLRYSGFDVLEPFASHAPGKADDDTRAHTLRRYDRRLRHLGAIPALFFHSPRVAIWGRSYDKATRLAQALSSTTREIEAPPTAAEAVAGADVVVTTTSSRTPILQGERLNDVPWSSRWALPASANENATTPCCGAPPGS